MEASSPTPTLNMHAAKKSDSTIEPNVLDQYRKDSSGKYWFELIPSTDKANRRKEIGNSIPNFFADMLNSGQFSSETSAEFEEYSAAVNKFLDEIN